MSDGLVGTGLSVRLGRRTILADLDVAFPPGWTALLGRNGAGKTTLIRALTGVLPLHTGRLSFRGEPIDDAVSWREYRQHLGWMPQDPAMPGGMRVAEIVEYAGWLKRVPRRGLVDARDQALAAGGALGLEHRRVADLSGGERRRAALSCALVGAPDVLLLDEPSTGLDPEQREAFDERLASLAQSVALVYSTHLLEDVLSAGRVCVLDGGSTVFAGSFEDFVGAAGGSDLERVRAGLKRVVVEGGS